MHFRVFSYSPGPEWGFFLGGGGGWGAKISSIFKGA